MSNHNHRPLRRVVSFWFILLSGGFIFGWTTPGSALSTTLNVTNFGAYGDAVSILANTTSNSYIVTTTNLLSSTDVGKVIEIFGAGGCNIWTNTQNTPPTPQTNVADLVAFIRSVANSTNITLDRRAGNTTNNASAIYGTQSATGFQNCINAASTNCTILIPAGHYLLIPPRETDSNAVFANGFDMAFAVTINSGGMHLLGAGAASTTLTGLGAWQATSNGVVTRGAMFGFMGPVTNDAPIIFEGLTMDGGVTQGRTSYQGWPARGDGDGWDCTHHALDENGQAPWNANKTFLNCNFVHWRGEMFICNVGFPYPATNTDTITGCVFGDGNGSGINLNFSHIVTGCIFTNLMLTAEIYEGYMAGPCIFSNNITTNILNGYTILGAQFDHVQATYTLISNNISGTTGINLSEAQNIIIWGNHFHNMPNGSAVYSPTCGAQSIHPATNNNVLIANNTFTNVGQAFMCGGAGVSTMQNLLFTNNVMDTGAAMLNGFGFGTNMIVKNNLCVNAAGVDSSLLQGQWYYDDLSNQFPYLNINDFSGHTNAVSYKHGARLNIHAVAANSAYYLDDSLPWAIPPGAQMILTNGSGQSKPLYMNASLTGTPLTITNGYTGTFAWMNGAWQLPSQNTPPAPPTDFHIVP